ncbi:unnamed protein product [Symbiodinium sp. CCMP2456]|nr:unnamed protein product [Symbiodinium sp. CCMP2456]
MHRHAPRLPACHDDWGQKPKVSHSLAFLIFIVLAAPGTVHGRLSAEGDQLVITIPVAKLRRDSPSHPLLDLPERAKILIDVGTHRESTFLTRLHHDPTAWVIAFEPDYLHYSHHVAKHAHPRMILINAAVGDSTRGWASFYRWSYEGVGWHFNSGDQTQLGSLLQAPGPGMKAREEMKVAVVSLSDVLSFLPGRVEILKVDAQGADLEVVKSAGDQLARVDRIVMELPYEVAHMTYADQTTEGDTETFLEQAGFRMERCFAVSEQEKDCTFARAHVWRQIPSEDECFSKNRTEMLFELWRDQINYLCKLGKYGCENYTPPLKTKRTWIITFCCSRHMPEHACFGRKSNYSYATCCLPPYLLSIGYPKPGYVM